MKLHLKLTHRFGALFRYILMSSLLMFVIDQIGKFEVPFIITFLFAVLIGLLLGVFRLFIGFDFIKGSPLIIRVLVQVAVIQIIIFLSASILQLFISYFEWADENIRFRTLLVSRDYFALYYKAQLFSFIFYFLTELENILGPRFFIDYILGKYRNPTVEHRVLLFMDLRNSTAIAERMGDRLYFNFLNNAYYLLDKPLMATNGEILKYVGDEVIISWKYEDGIAYDNCLRFFIQYKKSLQQNSHMFLKKYGETPDFKAGMHHGRIVAAYIGDIKKQLDFSGDTMNTTSRIMEVAKRSDCDLLISDKLFYALDYEKYEVKKFPNTSLKGKEEQMNLVGLKIVKRFLSLLYE